MTTKQPWVLAIAALGAVFLWLAQPPSGLWPLAYAGVAVWLWLATSPADFGRGEYLRVWLGGVLYWLLAMNWVRLPCWPLTAFGLPPLAMYLGLYALATVGLIRYAIRRWQVPLWLAAPIAWTGMELVQARLFTGLLMGAVSHSHAGQPWVRSVAAYAGAYGVTFAVVLVAAMMIGLVRGWRTPERGQRLVGVVAAVASVLVCGWLARTSIEIAQPEGRRPMVALIQGDIRATWDPDPQRNQTIMDRQVALTAEAAERANRSGDMLDLVVWPESMFRASLLSFDGVIAKPGVPNDASTGDHDLAIKRTGRWFEQLTGMLDATPMLVGIDRFDMPTDPDAPPSGGGLYNSAALVDGTGQLLSVYDKTHLVPFGEYIPFADGMPALYYLTRMATGMRAGDGPVAMNVPLRDGGTLRVCPSICYESVVPRVIRRQVAELTDQGLRPDVLVNVTNDAWFWGTGELDVHLACGVFRAIENGLPLIVAANGGLSAVVDATGEVRAVTGRQTEEVLIAPVPARSIDPTPYTLYGDWFAGACLLMCGLLGVSTLVEVRRAREQGGERL